jgi:hypothetical protein
VFLKIRGCASEVNDDAVPRTVGAPLHRVTHCESYRMPQCWNSAVINLMTGLCGKACPRDNLFYQTLMNFYFYHVK